MSPQRGSRNGDIAICNVFLGDIEVACRALSEACEHYRRAIQFYAYDSVAAVCFQLSTPSLSTIHRKLAMSLARLSNVTQAVVQYDAAIREARSIKNELFARMSLGSLYLSTGKYEQSVEQYRKSIELGQTLQNPLFLGKIFQNVAHAYLRLHQKEEAVCHFQKALRLITEYERDPETLFFTYNSVGSAYQSMNDLEKAKEYYELALQQEFRDIPSKIRIHDKISNVHIILKEYKEAIFHYTKMLHLSTDHKTTVTARLNRGYAYIKRAALLHAQSGESKIHGVHCDSNDCNCSSQVPDFTKELYDQGACDLRKVLEYYDAEIHKSLIEFIGTKEYGLACSCLQDCYVIIHELEKALVVAEKCRARVLGEHMLERSQLNRKSHITSPMTFPHIRKVIKELQSPVVYLTYTGSQIIVWILFSHSGQFLMNVLQVPLSNDLFGGQSIGAFLIHELTNSLMHPSNDVYQSISCNSDMSSQVQLFFDLIGRPLLQILDNFENKTGSSINKLIVISDEHTSLVPFSCLYDQGTKSFLTDKYCFQRVPSFLTLDIMLHQPAVKVEIPADSSRICVIGNSQSASAKKEAEWVANTLQTSPILKHKNMLSLKLNLLNAKMIHIATNGFKENGSLVVASGQAGASDYNLGPQTVQQLNISPALVVVTNCGEFVSTSIKAKQIEAMCQAFIQAGAQVFLTSLWTVPTESAMVFIQFFYQYLLDGILSSAAVQKAILSIRCFPEFSQYIHWSGYQLTGRDMSVSCEESQRIRDLRIRMGPGTMFPHRQAETQKLKEGLITDKTALSDVQVCPLLILCMYTSIVITFNYNVYRYCVVLNQWRF